MHQVLITGGTGDLGRAVVPRLLRDFRCVVAYRSEESWHRALESFGTHERLSGVSDIGAVGGPIYALVHLAGAFGSGSSAAELEKMLDANLYSFVRAAVQVTPRLEKGGRIVAISSIATTTFPAGLAAYVTAKAALNAYLQVLAKDLSKSKITANAVLPASMDTPENKKDGAADLVPTAHVAETIAFLLSEGAAEISGQLISLA